MGQSLLHRRACITKKPAVLQRGTVLQNGARAITKWVNRYCKVGWVLLSLESLLQSRTTITEKASTPS